MVAVVKAVQFSELDALFLVEVSLEQFGELEALGDVLAPEVLLVDLLVEHLLEQHKQRAFMLD